MDDKRVVNLKIGRKYKFKWLVHYGNQWREDKQHRDTTLKGEVVQEYKKFYVIKALKGGYCFTILKHSLRNEVMATAL